MTKKPARKKRKVSARQTRALALATEAAQAAMPVTRGQLADLRDEIEAIIQSYAGQLKDAYNRTDNAFAAHRQSKLQIEETRRLVDEARAVLAMDSGQPQTSALGDRVTWSYFHVWIARINERLTKLEGVKAVPARGPKGATGS